MLTGELRLELAKGSFSRYASDGELIYHVDELGAVDVLVRIDRFSLDGRSFIIGIDWKLSLSDLNKDSVSEVSKVPDLEYGLDSLKMKVGHIEGRTYYLQRKILEKRIIDSESEKREVLKLIKQAPFIFLQKADEAEWLEKFSSVLTNGRKVNEYFYYVLHTGIPGLDVGVDDERIIVDKLIVSNRGTYDVERVIDKKDSQKAKELIELFEKVLAEQANLQDAVLETLRSLGLNQNFPKRR